MDWPRLRRDPMKPEKGGAKRARAFLRSVVEDGANFTISVRRLDKSFGPRRGQWVAWVDQCGEDEFGMLATGECATSAVRRLGSDLQRVLHVAHKYPHLIATAYKTPGWAYAPETKEPT